MLGGGDGLAVREILKHPGIEHVTLVDLDPEMTRLFSTHPELTRLNLGALTDPRVHVVNQDAFVWLDETTDLYDFAVVDFPDPSNFSVGKLYTTAFYRALGRHLPRARTVRRPEHVAAVCAPGLLVRRRDSRSQRLSGVVRTTPTCRHLANGGSSSAAGPRTVSDALPDRMRFLTVAILPELFTFPPDMARVPVEPNRLNTQVLVRYYEREWRELNRYSGLSRSRVRLRRAYNRSH